MTIEERRDILFAAQHDLIGEEVDAAGNLVQFSYRERFIAACAANCAFFISTSLWIYDPEAREGEEMEVPFLLRPVQERYVKALVEAIRRGYDLGTEKSRSMGATWCFLAVFFWFWLFYANSSFLVGSLNRDKTDRKGDRTTLFAKLDYLIESLLLDVPFLYPKGYISDKPTRTYLKMLHPSNGSIITGEAPGVDFGRSGRYLAVAFDEFAGWKFGHASWTACSLTTKCHLPISTPKGMGNQFGKLMNPPRGNMGIRKFRLYWRDDPTKTAWARNNDPDRPWYEGPSGENTLIQPWLEFWKNYFNYDETMLAQEIEIDYSRSVQGQIYFNIGRAKRGDFPYNPDLPLYSTWDFGVRDFCAIIWIQYNIFTNEHIVIDSFQFTGRPFRWYVPFILGENEALGDDFGGYTKDQREIIERHAGFEYSAHYGDPAGRDRNPVTATSVIQEASKYGFKITTNSRGRNFEERINMTRILIPRLCIDEERNPELIEALENYHFGPIPEGTQQTTIVNKPVHDEYSHFSTALEYYSVNQKNNRLYAARVQTRSVPQAQSRVVFGNQALWQEYLKAQKDGRSVPQRRKSTDGTGYFS